MPSQEATTASHGPWWRADRPDVIRLLNQDVTIKVVLISAGLLLLLKTYLFARGLYRLYYHPLRKFPGPPEAAKSRSWLFQETMDGYPEDTFQALHSKYQTKALRIAPNELHISDVHLYKRIYSQSNPFPKSQSFYSGFMAAMPNLFTETDPVKHRERRRMLQPMFSRVAVFKLEPLIRETMEQLQKKIDRLSSEQDINLYDVFRLLTTNIIMEFSFASSGGMLQEEEKGFRSRFIDALSVAIHGFWIMERYPLLRYIFSVMPSSLMIMLKPEVGRMTELITFAESCVFRWQDSKDQRKTSHPVIFDNLHSLSNGAMVSEGVDLLVAGSDTTATSLTTAVLEILTHPHIEETLVNALDDAIPAIQDLPPLRDLEKIEYLTACVKEAIRFASAVPGRLPRVVPADNSEPFVVDGEVVPPGTVVSMSAHTMHTSVEIWGPDARSYNPERWLAPGAKSLEQYQCAFSKGARMCLGQNLVPAEITIALASIFRDYKMTLPPDFIPPRKIDVFTAEFQWPGLPVQVRKRR